MGNDARITNKENATIGEWTKIEKIHKDTIEWKDPSLKKKKQKKKNSRQVW